MQIKIKPLILLFLIPIIVFINSLILKVETGPYFYARNSDPEYAYLLNSLLILNSEPPKHVDHPGTPLQILGSIVIQITFHFQSFLGKHTSSTNTPHPTYKGKMYQHDLKKVANKSISHQTLQNKYSKQFLNQDVIQKPELYLSRINFLLLFLICFAILISGIITYLIRGEFYEAIFIQLIPILFLNTIKSNVRVSPEPLCLFGAIMFISLLIIYGM